MRRPQLATRPRSRRRPPGEVWLTPQQVKNANIAGAAGRRAGRRRRHRDQRQGHLRRSARRARLLAGHRPRVVASTRSPAQRVKKGAALAVIESPDIGSAFSDLDKAQADLDRRASTTSSARRSSSRRTPARRRTTRRARTTIGKAKAELERAQTEGVTSSGKGSADAVTQEYTLRAPIDGEVIARNVNPGIEVQGQYSRRHRGRALHHRRARSRSGSSPTCSRWISARVQDRRAASRCSVVAYPDAVFAGKVDWVSDLLDPTTRTAKVRCTLRQPQRASCKPEMYATVSIVGRPSAGRSPSRDRAILRLGDQTVVFVQNGTAPDGLLRFERRPVAVDEDEGGDCLPVDARPRARREGRDLGRHPARPGCCRERRAMIHELVALRAPDARHRRLILALGLPRRWGSTATSSSTSRPTRTRCRRWSRSSPSPTGWSAEEVERYVTIPLEIGLAGMPGLDHIRSQSLFGLSDVKCYFNWGTDVRRRAAGGHQPPAVRPAAAGHAGRSSRRGTPSARSSATGARARATRSRDLKTARGLDPRAAVQAGAGRHRRRRASAARPSSTTSRSTPTACAAHGVTLAQLISAHRRRQPERRRPAPRRSASRRTTCAASASSATLHDIERHRRRRAARASPVRVRDVADVEVGHAPRLGIVGQDDEPDVVQGIVLMRYGGETRSRRSTASTSASTTSARTTSCRRGWTSCPTTTAATW